MDSPSTSSPTAAWIEESRFAQLVRDHQATLWRYLRFLGATPAEADDLVQETFLTVWRRPFEDRGPAAQRAYLRTIARNYFLKGVRREQLAAAYRDLAAADAAWEEFERGDGGDGYREALQGCMQQLEERPRQALGLFYTEGRSREQVAQALGMTANGIKTLLRRTRDLLRSCVERKLRA